MTTRVGGVAASQVSEELSSFVRTECVKKKRNAVCRSFDDTFCREFDELFAPVLNSHGIPLGILWCRNHISEEKNPSYSTLAVDVLEVFASAVGPAFERILRLRNDSSLMKVVRDLAPLVVKDSSLQRMLDLAIESVLECFSAEMGSIYLIDDEATLTMRAGAGRCSSLVGTASYRIGEGITGNAAKSQDVLNYTGASQILASDNRLGKYDARLFPDEGQCETLLVAPIWAGKRLLGVWKVGNVRPNVNHPDAFFTDDDVHSAKVLSGFLAYAIDRERHLQTSRMWADVLSKSVLSLLRTKSEEDTIFRGMETLDTMGFSCMLSLYDATTQMIVGHTATGRKWPRIVSSTMRDINGDDILATVLERDQPEFVPNSTTDSRCDQEAALLADVKAFYAIPLRLEDELIGTLQVDMSGRPDIPQETKTMLHGIASCFAIAISRDRAIRRSAELLGDLASESRFVAAETLAGMAIHSLGHRLNEIQREIKISLQNQKVRENKFLNSTMTDWQKKLTTVETDVQQALKIVREGPTGEHTEFEAEVQNSLDVWFLLLQVNKCQVETKFGAPRGIVRIRASALREILSVLIVNSVQAFANSLRLSTSFANGIRLPDGHVVDEAISFTIEDNGDGIRTVQPEELFSASYTTKPDKIGTGLGLFIAKKLAMNGGGDLLYDGRGAKGRGARFRLILPLQEIEG